MVTAGAESNPAFVAPAFEKGPKESRRGLMVVVAVVLTAIVLLVAADSLGVFTGPPPLPTPLDTALSLGTVRGESWGPSYVARANFTIQAAALGLTLGSLTPGLANTSTGVMVTPPPGSFVELQFEGYIAVADYSSGAGTWNGMPSSTHVTSQDQFVLFWNQATANDPFADCSFVVQGSNGYTGTVSDPMH